MAECEIASGTPHVSRHFYQLASDWSNRWYRGQLESQASFSVLQNAWRGQVMPREPVTITPLTGRYPSDFIWADLFPIIHERVVKLFAEEGVTGWELYPVRVLARSGEQLPGYHGLAILGRCDSIETDKENVVLVEMPSGKKSPHFQGLKFDEETWDGSDLFRPRDGRTDYVLVTSKVHDAFLRLGVKNVALTSIEDFRILKWTPTGR